MSQKKKKSSSKAAPKKTPYSDEISEFMLAVGASENPDKAALIRQMSAILKQEATGRKRKLSEKVADQALRDALEFYHSPDVSAIFAKELVELFQMEDLAFVQGEGVYITLSTAFKGDRKVLLKNLTVNDFIELDTDPHTLMAPDKTLSDILPVVAKILDCENPEDAGVISVNDLWRIWGQFTCFFLGR
jgi:hypothetical protein